MNYQIHSTTGKYPYCVVFKQKMRMQCLSFTDRATTIPEDKNEELHEELDEELDGELNDELDGSELDASNWECGNDSESLADDREYDSE